MDLTEAIRQLYAERERLDRVIASLERLENEPDALRSRAATPKRRGRKAMTAEERRQVSERMRQYWADRRKGGGPKR
jgi:hypothetical protein